MKYEEDYKTYKLYSITDQDIAASGGEGTSRLIKNDVLVFAPDIERPEIGLEIFTAKTKEDALSFITSLADETAKTPIQEVLQSAVERSQILRQHLENEKERKQIDDDEIKKYPDT